MCHMLHRMSSSISALKMEHSDLIKTSLGKPSYKKNGKKADNVRFGRPPPTRRVKSGHLLSEKARKSRQLCFRDKTAYVWGLGYH